MKKILAVSGGVDSVVLLHMFRDDPDIVVAHFNHGIRTEPPSHVYKNSSSTSFSTPQINSAAADENFVRELAEKYDKPFYVGHAHLGEHASEEAARISRYEYFAQLAKELDGEIYTAHHADDLIETIVINLIRGTGWRGLTPFGNTKIRRPFIETAFLPKNTPVEMAGRSLFRSDIYHYASENHLHFRLDPTNSDEKYLRNRIRLKLQNLPKSQKLEILELYHNVNNLKQKIDTEIQEILSSKAATCVTKSAKTGKSTKNAYSRQFLANLDDNLALELLREILKREGIFATRPQLKDFLAAIRTYPAGRKFNLPKDRFAKIGTHGIEILPATE